MTVLLLLLLSEDEVVEELEEDESSGPSVEEEDSVRAMEGGMETAPLIVLSLDVGLLILLLSIAMLLSSDTKDVVAGTSVLMLGIVAVDWTFFFLPKLNPIANLSVIVLWNGC